MNYSRTDEGEQTILYVRGELDALSAGDLRPALDQLVNEGRKDVIVDLSALRLVDSSGVGALVSLYKRVHAAGGQVVFTGVTAQPLVIFKLLRLDVVFEIPARDVEVARQGERAAVDSVPPSIRVVRS